MSTTDERTIKRTLASDAGEAADAARRFAERADREGLADVAYATLDTPLGTAMVAGTERGLIRVMLPNEPVESALERIARDVSPRLLEAPARLDGARRELGEYFEGARRAFDLPLDWALSRGFRRQVLGATARIAYGQTGTYASVATEAGSPRAVRAAGTALATNPIPIIVPCHRVLRSDGTLGGYRGGPERKDTLLRLEAGHAPVR